jgi:hypothetical protein
MRCIPYMFFLTKNILKHKDKGSVVIAVANNRSVCDARLLVKIHTGVFLSICRLKIWSGW